MIRQGSYNRCVKYIHLHEEVLLLSLVTYNEHHGFLNVGLQGVMLNTFFERCRAVLPSLIFGILCPMPSLPDGPELGTINKEMHNITNPASTETNDRL